MISQLYLISEGESGPVKVGRSRNPNARLSELQTGNPRRLKILASYKMDRNEVIRAEELLHFELDDFYGIRLAGEWFDISESSILSHMPDFFESDGFEVIP